MAVIFSNTRIALTPTKGRTQKNKRKKKKKKKKEIPEQGWKAGRLWATPGNIFFLSQHQVSTASFRYVTESKSSSQGCFVLRGAVHGEVENNRS